MIELLFIWAVLIITIVLIGKILDPSWKLMDSIRRIINQILIKLQAKTLPQRHIFDPFLYEQLIQIVKEFSHPQFEVEIYHYLYQNAPCLELILVPKGRIEQEDLTGVCQLLKVKFREYLSVYGLKWKYFVQFRTYLDNIHFYIVYIEMNADIKPAYELFNKFKAEKTTNTNHEAIHDKMLDRELEEIILEKCDED